jgi:hypothetical protein
MAACQWALDSTIRVIVNDAGIRILEVCSKDVFFGKPEVRKPQTRDFLN